MPTAEITLYLQTGLPPTYGKWEVFDRKRYPDADYAQDEAYLFTGEAKSGAKLSLDDCYAIEKMIMDKVASEGGGPLETLILYRTDLVDGETETTYRVYHAAHGSPALPIAAIIAFIAANWQGILIALGVLAAIVLGITFLIKAIQITWKTGSKIDDFVSELPPAAVAMGLGILLVFAVMAFSGKSKEGARA